MIILHISKMETLLETRRTLVKCLNPSFSPFQFCSQRILSANERKRPIGIYKDHILILKRQDLDLKRVKKDQTLPH